jgi:hypothetical protein
MCGNAELPIHWLYDIRDTKSALPIIVVYHGNIGSSIMIMLQSFFLLSSIPLFI